MILFLNFYPHLAPLFSLAHYIQKMLIQQHCSFMSGKHLLISAFTTIICHHIK